MQHGTDAKLQHRIGPQHVGLGRVQDRQPVQRAFGPEFLDHTDGCVGDDDETEERVARVPHQ